MAWPEDDRDKAMAYTVWRSQFCTECGTRDRDWLDESGRLRDNPPLRASLRRCRGCVEVERAMGTVPDDEDRAGLKVHLVERG